MNDTQEIIDRYVEAAWQLQIAVMALDQAQAMLRDVDWEYAQLVAKLIVHADQLLNELRKEYACVCPKCGYRLSRDGAALCKDCYQKEG